MSGRYLLTDNYKKVDYDSLKNRVVVLERKTSQFPSEVTAGMQYQYMSRLWSWPTALTDEVITTYEDGFVYIAERISQGGYCDIEHMLYKFLPQEHVHEVAMSGVSGNIGPNGARVDD